MKQKKLLAAVLLSAAAIGISVPLLLKLSDRRLLTMPEDAAYAEMQKRSAGQLIRKINRLEKKLPSMEDKTALLPLYAALIDKADEFSAEQLIAQIKRKKTLAGIESAFVEMYAADGYDSAGMLELLDDPELAEETKEHIVSHCDFSAAELCDIFRSSDGRTAVIAIQKLAASDSEQAMALVQEFVSDDSAARSNDQNIAVCLGIAQYYEDHRDTPEGEEMKRIYVPMIQKIFEQSGDTLVQNQAVYALGRMCDYDLFKWVIEHDRIDFYTKISVIERNVRLMQTQIASAESEEDIRAVIEAMQLHPVLDVGEALQEAIDQGRLSVSDELTALIAHIREEGVPAVNKYD